MNYLDIISKLTTVKENSIIQPIFYLDIFYKLLKIRLSSKLKNENLKLSAVLSISHFKSLYQKYLFFYHIIVYSMLILL